MKIEDILGPFVYKQLFPVTSRLVNLNLKESLIMSKRIFLTYICIYIHNKFQSFFLQYVIAYYSDPKIEHDDDTATPICATQYKHLQGNATFMCLDDDQYPKFDIENAIYYHYFSVVAMLKVGKFLNYFSISSPLKNLKYFFFVINYSQFDQRVFIQRSKISIHTCLKLCFNIKEIFLSLRI